MVKRSEKINNIGEILCTVELENGIALRLLDPPNLKVVGSRDRVGHLPHFQEDE